MKYYAYTIDLKNNEKRIEEYLEHHRNPRKDVIQAVVDTGVVDEKIWISGNHLFMIVVADDNWDPSNLQKYAMTSAGKEWDELMRAYQQPVKEAREGEWWSQMSLVVDLDADSKKLQIEKRKQNA